MKFLVGRIKYPRRGGRSGIFPCGWNRISLKRMDRFFSLCFFFGLSLWCLCFFCFFRGLFFFLLFFFLFFFFFFTGVWKSIQFSDFRCPRVCGKQPLVQPAGSLRFLPDTPPHFQLAHSAVYLVSHSSGNHLLASPSILSHLSATGHPAVFVTRRSLTFGRSSFRMRPFFFFSRGPCFVLFLQPLGATSCVAESRLDFHPPYFGRSRVVDFTPESIFAELKSSDVEQVC